MKVTIPEERELKTVYVCYDCFDKQWKGLETGWIGPIVAVFHRLKGHDVRRAEVIPDEGIIVSSARTSHAT
ncbi:hypothetical protein AKJ40_00825 [candidate division MSBL1 archaeon SCGC-AAA259M10]|uniref:Uncharacterized protein n=1 Tax=candidate division MSBL1 archaeon SCGC-AAA259M10 TaxID=1698270 RepID=A0A133V2V3_9EURY|nr:hypothetical protein AKJ40_00825 [candidate division MSBL1 archaeon SCGC-AAA259M10]